MNDKKAIDRDTYVRIHQRESCDDACGINADKDLDGFARISDRVGKIGIEIGISFELIAAINWNDGRIALRRTETIGARKEVSRCNLRQIGGEIARGGRLCPRRWEAPETFDAETAAEMRNSSLMTPYRALATAVRNEERAFAFWSYIAAFAEEPEVKKAAEAMAREELGHVSTLRRERRRAYHREHDEWRAEGSATGQVDTGALERRLAEHLSDLERRLSGPLAERTRELRQETIAMAAQASGLGRLPARLERSDAKAIAEALTDVYLESAEAARDPVHLEKLQALAERAISRLAWLRSLA